MRAFAATWLLPIDGAPIRDGLVVVEDRGIVREIRPRVPSDDVPLFDGVILPGLVNAHTHLEGSAYKGLVERGGGIAGFAEGWLAARKKVPEAEVERAAKASVEPLLEAGTALVGDVTNTGVVRDALRAAPLHAVVFHESVEGAPTQALPETFDAAHTPWSSPAEWIREAYRRAQEENGLTSLHVAEHPDERQFLLDGSGPLADLYRRLEMTPKVAPCGRSPIEYVGDLGALGPHALAVHLVDTTPRERAILRTVDARLVLCPRSNDYIGGRLPDLPAILAEGLRPALGTDSLASSPSLDVLEEARAFHQAFPEVPCASLLAMATAWGARAMRRPSLGAIRPGGAPGILLAKGEPGDDPERWLVESCAPRRWLLPPGGVA